MPKKATITATITTRALVQRINRKLADEDRRLKATRGDRARSSVGNFYVVDLKLKTIVAHMIDDLEEWAREEMPGVLAAWERVED
jgi:hypothetical protein